VRKSDFEVYFAIQAQFAAGGMGHGLACHVIDGRSDSARCNDHIRAVQRQIEDFGDSGLVVADGGFVINIKSDFA